ncbi:DUF7692 domain-containing protein [Halarchaeum nitratireducens]|uniref:DUF7692 domain-containing protein n=1 Tax=Halarchaeum nitratireducens TaxID=489913 RepID=A0A830GCD9_9EURY|nr:hypothetical protein [Halarchaeum nitratireducens]GGN17906.1 hypothetical protein GCM10009021_18530 [Halarchaeum nitratireducens]
MRIRTDGDYAYWKDVIEDAADFWGVNKTDAIVRSCDLAGRLVPQLEEALTHEELPPRVAQEIVEMVNRECRNVLIKYCEPNVKVSFDV